LEYAAHTPEELRYGIFSKPLALYFTRGGDRHCIAFAKPGQKEK
jgi:hypothetical protein